jgi:predicted MFS family arabinose efflux permease
MAIALEFGSDAEKPTYVGMSNTLIAPATILAPIIGGLLADLLSYENTFVISSLFGALTFLIIIIFVNDPHKKLASEN